MPTIKTIKGALVATVADDQRVARALLLAAIIGIFGLSTIFYG